MVEKMRESWIDAWKGLLIFLVVLGHVVGGMRYYIGPKPFSVLDHLYTAIYLFHMPAFFVLAGLLVGERRREKHEGLTETWKVAVKKARRLLVPYFVWGFGSALVFVVLSQFADVLLKGTTNGPYVFLNFDGPWWQPFVSILHAGGWPDGRGFLCNGVLWFLPCMFCVALAYEGVRGVRGAGVVLFCFALARFIQLSGCGRWPWSIDRLPYFLGFFLVGARMSGFAFRLQVARLSIFRWRNGAALMVGWGIYGVLAWRYPNLAYSRLTWGWYGASVALAIGGSVLSLWTAQLIGRAGVPGMLERIGVASLGIMLCHKFIVLPVQCTYRWILPTDQWVVCLVLSIVLAVLITAVAMVGVNVVRKIAPWSIGEKRRQDGSTGEG